MIEFHGATAWPTYQLVLWVCSIVNMCFLCMCSLQLCPVRAAKLTVIFEISLSGKRFVGAVWAWQPGLSGSHRAPVLSAQVIVHDVRLWQSRHGILRVLPLHGIQRTRAHHTHSCTTRTRLPAHIPRGVMRKNTSWLMWLTCSRV